MCTASGQEIFLAEPHRTKLLTSDIQTALGNERRYGGFADVTVLAHLALCTALADIHRRHAPKASIRYADRDEEFHFLLAKAYASAHDGQEFALKDIPKGLKECLAALYGPLEDAWAAHFHASFGLVFPRPPEFEAFVHFIDLRALVIEQFYIDWPIKNDNAAKYGGPPSKDEKELAVLLLDPNTSKDLQWDYVHQSILAPFAESR